MSFSTSSDVEPAGKKTLNIFNMDGYIVIPKNNHKITQIPTRAT